MQLRSEVLSVSLPNHDGKTVSFYTYDGYLEDSDRHRIRSERKGLEKLAVTGSAILGLVSFIVNT